MAADAGRNLTFPGAKSARKPGRAVLAAWGLAAFLSSDPLLFAPPGGAAAPSEPAKSVALLNVQFLNDHEDLEPTTGAERARLALIASLFKAKLEGSGRYTFVSIPADGGKNCGRS